MKLIAILLATIASHHQPHKHHHKIKFAPVPTVKMPHITEPPPEIVVDRKTSSESVIEWPDAEVSEDELKELEKESNEMERELEKENEL